MCEGSACTATRNFAPLVRGVEYRAVVFNAAKDGNLQRLKIFLDSRDEEFVDGCLNVRNGATDKVALVIAARNGNLDVVRYLLSKKADPRLCGTVSFDGETIYGAPPLWAAAAAGHLEVTKCLVDEAKVDINQTTQTNSSPLRGACYDGHLDIVKFLLDRGADLELANRHGHTPLMIASFRQKVDVVDFLLQKGADPTRSSTKGNTALHDAAEADCKEACELLLQAGARLKNDDSGVCPLLGAAMLANLNVFPVLLRFCENSLRRKDAFRILGCTLVDKKMDIEGAVQSWQRALATELTPEEEEMERIRGTLPLDTVYDGFREARTIEELTRIKDSPEAIRMQALILRERILGKNHTDVHYFLRLRGAVYCDMGDEDRCFALWMYALTLQQASLHPLHTFTMATIYGFFETFNIALNEESIEMFRMGNRDRERAVPITFDHIDRVFDRVCHEIERLADYCDRSVHEDCGDDAELEEDDERKRICQIALQLLLVMERLRMILYRGDGKMQKQQLDVARLIKAAVTARISLLHIAVSEFDRGVGLRGVDDLHFPSLHCVQVLLDEGVNPNIVDERKNTPLHLLLNTRHNRGSIVKALLEAGAYLHARNEDNETCLQLLSAKLPSLFKDLRIGRYMTLLGTAAVATRRNGLPYESVVPKDIHPFVQLH